MNKGIRIALTGWLGTILVTLSGCQPRPSNQSPVRPSRPDPLPQDLLVEVSFNHNPATDYQEPDRKYTRSGDNLEAKIIQTIAAAQTSVDVAVQELRLPRIAQALVERQQAGVKVRVILENSYSHSQSELSASAVAQLKGRERDRYREYFQLMDQNGDGQLSPAEVNQGDALVILRNGKIPWIDDTADGSKGSKLMHHKFVVVDRRIVIATSANFTSSDIHGDVSHPGSRGNRNNFLKIESSELAALFTEEFNLMWGDGPGGKPDSKFGIRKPVRPTRSVLLGNTLIQVHFSPTPRRQPWRKTTNGLIGETLQTAKQSIDLALFVFSEEHLSNLLEKQHEQGVQIRTLIEPGFAYRPYSNGLKMLGISLPDGNSGCRMRNKAAVWRDPITTIGVPHLPKGDLLHHKFGLVDERIVITGSHNWTDSANEGNDETLLVIHSPIVAAHYKREFDQLYQKASLGVPRALQLKQQSSQDCPSQ